MYESHDKFARLMRLDQLLRNPDGVTIEEMLTDPDLDSISERLLRDNLKELEKYGADFAPNLYRGRKRLWRYKDTSFSVMQQTSKDMEIIHQSLEHLSLFKGDPRYDVLRFYLIGLGKGIKGTYVNFMSFDNNADVSGLDNIEILADAIINKYPLKMNYKPFGKDAFDSNIHPYHLRQYNKRWFLFAYSEDKGKIMNFPLDRILKLEHLSKQYIETDIDFDEYFDDIVGVTNEEESPVEKVILKVDNTSIDYIRTKPIHGSQKELRQLQTDTHTFIQLELKVNYELKMLLFSYFDSIEILEPTWLRDFFIQKIEKMSKKYIV